MYFTWLCLLTKILLLIEGVQVNSTCISLPVYFASLSYWSAPCTRYLSHESKVKVNQSTCIAPCMVQTTLKRSGMDHTAFNLQRTTCMLLPRNRSPDGAYTECGGDHLIAAHYTFIDPERMKGWVGLVGCPIADGLPIWVVTHQLQDGERTLARDWRSTAEPRGPTDSDCKTFT